MDPAQPPARHPLPLEAALFAAVAAFAVLFAHFHQARNLIHPEAALDRLCAYAAETPYQNRVLVPTLVRAVEATGLNAKLGFTQLDCALAIEAICVIGFFYALRALLRKFIAGNWPPTWWAAAGLYALPFHYVLPRAWPYWYPWDLPAVLFTTLGVLWIREQRWAWYYWVFPFATLNRETTSFLIVVFALTQFGKMRWFELAQHLASQFAIWIGIKLLLNFTFSRNPGIGEYYADALKDNWALVKVPASWGTLILVFGFLWLPLLVFARHIQDRFARRALCVVPLFFAFSFVLAQFDELRIYGEMLPLVVLALACGVESWRMKRAAVGHAN